MVRSDVMQSEPEVEGEAETNGVGGLQVSERNVLGALV